MVSAAVIVRSVARIWLEFRGVIERKDAEVNNAIEILGLSASERRSRGAEWTAREIAQQPTLWPELAHRVSADARLREYLSPLLADPALRIVCAGAGTSAYVGECLAPTLARMGRRVDAVATTDIVASPEASLARDVPTLVVHFARSGNSPESVAALDLAERHIDRCAHLVVTCNPDGNLLRQAEKMPRVHSIVLPDACNDRGFAMTSSFSGMLLAAAQALEAIKLSPQRIESLAGSGDGVLTRQVLKAKELVEMRFDRAVFLGSNELKGVARESALKMLELTDGQVVSLAESPLGLRHGPKTIVNGSTLVVFFMSNDRYTRQYDEDLLQEICSDGQAGHVIALTAQASERGAGDVIDLGLDYDEEGMPSDLELCLPYVAFAQLLALHRSLSLGLTPDNPNAAGTVSRVVRGVSIHPYPHSGLL